PDVIVVCVSSNADLGDIPFEFPAIVTLFGGRGLAQKRNAILRHLSDLDVLIFLDDDFLVDRDYVAATEAAFASDDAIAMSTGDVIADGVCGPGLDVTEARLALVDAGRPAVAAPHDVYSAYGCNMSLRFDLARRHELTF